MVKHVFTNFKEKKFIPWIQGTKKGHHFVTVPQQIVFLYSRFWNVFYINKYILKASRNFRFLQPFIASWTAQNLIDSCQAHLPVQFTSNIEFVRQMCQCCCDWPGFYTKLNVWGSLGLDFDYDGGPIIENGGPIFLYMDLPWRDSNRPYLSNRCRKTSSHFRISTVN